MNQQQVETFVETLDNVQREENYGYHFYFVGNDHRLPFVTFANTDQDFDNVSNLNREGVFRVNIGVSKETFDSLVGVMENPDYTVLNVFLPHPDYAKQHWVCILNPAGENEALTQKLIREAHSIATTRYEKITKT